MLAVAQITIRDDADVVIGTTAPASPVKDMLWLDTSVTPHQLRCWNGSAWVECGADVDLSAYYTKTEVNTRFAQTDQAISAKADSSTVSSLGERIEQAEQKVSPEGIAATVASAALHAYDKYLGRNYCLNSGVVHTFVDNKYVEANGAASAYATRNLSISDDLFAHSGNGTCIRISFDIKRTGVDASTSSSTNVYSGAWVYYRYYGGMDGTTLYTTGRGWYLRTTDSSFASTDSDWVRMRLGPLNIASANPISIAYFALGTSGANGMTGTVQFRNVKLEVLDQWTDWSAAPEDLYGLSNRMANAESSIRQNANNIALKVNTSTYNTEKVYRGSSAPATLYINMLWLDTSVSPNLLKRYTGSAWVVAGAEEVKSSGVYIGPNNVAITTENFLLQLLDPSNNENVLMEMSADGNVGFKELYADEVVSDSVVNAYTGPTTLYVYPSYTGTSTVYFRSLREAVGTLNGKYLRYDVTVTFLNSTSETIYETQGVQVFGITGPSKLRIVGTGKNKTIMGYFSIKSCSANISLEGLTLYESRPLIGGTGKNAHLIESYYCNYVTISNCYLDCCNNTYRAVQTVGSYVDVSGTQFYNAYIGLGASNGTGFMNNCTGSCDWAVFSVAGIVFCAGTAPSGGRTMASNGQLFDAGVSSGGGGGGSTVVTTETTTQYATLTKSYRGGWRGDTVDVIQGVYSDSGYKSGLNWNYGCMWFGNLRNVLAGATVKSATLTLHRKTGSGSGSAKTVYLCAISNTSASGSPSIAVNYGAIGTIGRNAQVTFSIPIEAVQGLADGTYGGLCLYESKYNFGSSTYSSCYMRMSGTDSSLKPYLTVVYTGTAVG